MSKNQYLLVLSKPGQSFKPLKEKFHELEGFYNGVGYAFPSKSGDSLRQILEPLNLRIHSLPLSEGESFNSLRQAHTTTRFRENLLKKETELLQFKNYFNLDEVNENAVESSNLTQLRKEEGLALIQECEELKSGLKWAEAMEKALVLSPKEKFSIKFINEMKNHFLLDEPPEMPRLVNFNDNGTLRPFIRKGIVGMIVGAGGIGKTHFLTQLGLSIASGTPFLSKFPIERTGSVFIGLGENSEEDIHRLLRKTYKGMFYTSPSLDFEQKKEIENISKRLSVMSFTGMQASFIHQNSPTGLFQALFNELKLKEPEEGWSCIILDPISRFLGSDAETDNAAATQFIALLEKLTLELKGKPTVLFGHHMNKSGVSGISTDQAAARGSSAITDGVRFQINLDKVLKDGLPEKDKINMRMVKSNFTAIVPEQILRKDDLGCLRCEMHEHSKTKSKIAF